MHKKRSPFITIQQFIFTINSYTIDWDKVPITCELYIIRVFDRILQKRLIL